LEPAALRWLIPHVGQERFAIKEAGMASKKKAKKSITRRAVKSFKRKDGSLTGSTRKTARKRSKNTIEGSWGGPTRE
jgi:hypothetical protein